MDFISIFSSKCDDLWDENLGLRRKKSLQRVMLDYTR